VRHRAILAAAFAGVFGLSGRAEAQAQPRIMVMPFENVARDSRIFWLTEAAAVLLADNLNALGANAITREERRAAFERLQVPPAAVLTDATVIRIGQLVGASHVIVGGLQLKGETLLIRAKSIALEAGRIQTSATQGGPLTELFSIFERMGREFAPPGTGGAASSPFDNPPDNPPVRAFENYIKGLLAETPGTAINYLNASLKAYPSFDRPRLALWEVYTDQGDHERALTAVKAVPVSARFGRRASFLAALSQLTMKRFEEAFRLFTVLLKERPTAAVYNNLGVVQLRRGASAETGLATYYFNRAAEMAALDVDYFFNLGYAYWLQRDVPAAMHWLREAVRRDPTDGDAHLVLAAALASAGQTLEATRERELAKRLSSKYEDIDRRPAADPVPAGLERVKSDVELLPYLPSLSDSLAVSGQREQRELARFHLEAGQRMFQEERDRDALQELNRVLFLSPYEARAHLLVGRIHLRSGRLAEAIDALKISLWSEETAEAHTTLAEAYLAAKEIDAARSEAERALVMDAGDQTARRILERTK
jgi:tetratricopeptide (TPR) repeat protein